VCSICGFDYHTLSVTRALRSIAGLPQQIRAAALAVPVSDRTRRPDPTTWSVTEYVCHVRDVLVVSTVRLHRTRTETNPVLEPMLNDLRARRFRYYQRALEPVLTELTPLAEGLCEEVEEFSAHEWNRTATRRPGETRTARWLVRHAVHEGVHHVGDIRAVGRRVADPHLQEGQPDPRR
jgi:uncharacterized damage-inducible protein DinB